MNAPTFWCQRDFVARHRTAHIGATEPHEWFAIYEYDFGGSGYMFFGWMMAPGSHAHALKNLFESSLLCHPQSTFVLTYQDGTPV